MGMLAAQKQEVEIMNYLIKQKAENAAAVLPQIGQIPQLSTV
jgi:hypothetical protein